MVITALLINFIRLGVRLKLTPAGIEPATSP